MICQFPTSIRILLQRATALALLCLLPCAGLHAQQQKQEKPEAILSEKGAELLTEASTKMEAKDYAGATVVLQQMIAQAEPGSYDLCAGSLMLAQCLLVSDQLEAAIQPLERAIDLGFFDAKGEEKFVTTLVHLYFQMEKYDKAEARLKSFLSRQAKPGADLLFVYATVLYQLNKFDEALAQTKRAMRAQLEVRDELLLLAVACSQQVKQYQEAIAYLETLVSRHPDKENYWGQLAATYASVDNPLGALLAMQRASERGHMNSPADNLTRVQLLYNLDQFADAAALLEKGLTDGSIENVQGNWELLAYCYKQLYREDRMREVLEKASATTSWSGIDLQLAELNWQARRFKETITNLESALRKGNIAKPGDVYLLMASAQFELGEYDKAKEALASAEGTPELKSKVESLRKAINEIQERKRLEEQEKSRQTVSKT